MKRAPQATQIRGGDITGVARRALAARIGEARAESDEVEARLLTRVVRSIEKYCPLDHAADTDAEAERFVGRLRLDELRLVVRCEAGDEEAWRELIETFTPTVRGAARAACAGEAEAEELAASVWAELYGLRANAEVTEFSGEDEQPAGQNRTPSTRGKLAHYSGCGSLGGWLRAVVAQLAVDRYRRSRRLVQPEDEREMECLEHRRGDADDAGKNSAANFRPPAAPSPEQAFASREASELLRAALDRAAANLEAEERLLLKLYYTDGLRLREAGAVLGVSEATASRRLAAIHKRLREAAIDAVIAERGATRAEVTRLLAEAAADSDADLRSLLHGKPSG